MEMSFSAAGSCDQLRGESGLSVAAMRDLLGSAAGYYRISFSACRPAGSVGLVNFLHRLLKRKQLVLNPLNFVQYLGNRLRRIETHI
jgi:hypothetical protein